MWKLSLILLGAFVFVSCGYRETPQLEYMPDMYRQPSMQAQEFDPRSENGVGMRVPVEGTVPRDWEPYRFGLADSLQADAMRNPFPANKEILEVGRKYYMTYCVVCHGATGDGRGYIVPKFTMPPSLYAEKLLDWTDGRIYHTITNGQGLMPGYASQLLPRQRWAIVHYVRALQRAAYPTPEDLAKFPDSPFTFEDDLPDTAAVQRRFEE